MAWAARHTAPYNFDMAFFVPSVAHLVISSTVFWHTILATGRPQITTPHNRLPSYTARLNRCPTTGLWWRWSNATRRLASTKVQGSTRSV